MASIVGDRIKQARTKAGLTQEGLGDAIGSHKFTVSKWERGETSPGKPSDYVRVAQVCNVSHGWLKNGVGSVDETYLPVYEEGRRTRERELSGKHTKGTAQGQPDWTLIANLVGRFVNQATMKPDRLAKALELGYAMAARGTLDEEMVQTILRMV